ncbi:MAG TPA: NUDIX domain-containing protein [Oculatellaceae cyanobacterium]
MKNTAAALVYRKRKTEVEILLVRELGKKNSWSLPKGKVKRSETVKQAALRETKEETAVKLAKVIPLGSVKVKKKEKTLHCFMASAPKGANPKADLREVEYAGFIGWKKARKLLTRSQAAFISMFLEKFKSKSK